MAKSPSPLPQKRPAAGEWGAWWFWGKERGFTAEIREVGGVRRVLGGGRKRKPFEVLRLVLGLLRLVLGLLGSLRVRCLALGKLMVACVATVELKLPLLLAKVGEGVVVLIGVGVGVGVGVA